MNEQRIEIAFVTPLRIVEEPEPPSSGKQVMIIEYEQFEIIVEGDRVMYNLPVDHLVTMEVSYVDTGGNPATVDGAVAWACSDVTMLTLSIDPSDSAIVTVTPVGPIGQVQVTATADADLGAGVRNIITVADIEIVAGEAVAGSIQPMGEAQPIAPHAEPRK
jgi:hypothetical protein